MTLLDKTEYQIHISEMSLSALTVETKTVVRQDCTKYPDKPELIGMCIAEYNRRGIGDVFLDVYNEAIS